MGGGGGGGGNTEVCVRSVEFTPLLQNRILQEVYLAIIGACHIHTTPTCLDHLFHIHLSEGALAGVQQGEADLEQNVLPLNKEQVHDPEGHVVREYRRKHGQKPRGGVHGGLEALHTHTAHTLYLATHSCSPILILSLGNMANDRRVHLPLP